MPEDPSPETIASYVKGGARCPILTFELYEKLLNRHAAVTTAYRSLVWRFRAAQPDAEHFQNPGPDSPARYPGGLSLHQLPKVTFDFGRYRFELSSSVSGDDGVSWTGGLYDWMGEAWSMSGECTLWVRNKGAYYESPTAGWFLTRNKTFASPGPCDEHKDAGDELNAGIETVGTDFLFDTWLPQHRDD